MSKNKLPFHVIAAASAYSAMMGLSVPSAFSPSAERHRQEDARRTLERLEAQRASPPQPRQPRNGRPEGSEGQRRLTKRQRKAKR